MREVESTGTRLQQRLLREAAQAPLDRIRRDREHSPERVGGMLAFIEKHLFEWNFDVTRLKIGCGERDNSIVTAFKNVVGLSPHAYIVDRRMETAAVLLQNTTLRTAVVGRLVGIPNHRTFGRNFNSWSGYNPSVFRRRAKETAEKWGQVGIELSDYQTLRKAMLGGLDGTEATELIERIAAVNELPKAEPAPTPPEHAEAQGYVVKLPFTQEVFEQIMVKEVWQVLRQKSWDEQREIVRNQIRFTTPALFHFLRERSIPEGRDNREFGVHLAELAMDSLTVTESVYGEEIPELKAQAWTWMAQTRRLAEDIPGAESAFTEAEQRLKNVGRESELWGEFCFFMACFRWRQTRFDEALALAHDSLSIYRPLGRNKQVAKNLILRANINILSGHTSAGIRFLSEANQLIDTHGDEHLSFAITFNLAAANVAQGSFERALKYLPKVKTVCGKIGTSEGQLDCLWLEGAISLGLRKLQFAETYLEQAYSGFKELGLLAHAGMAGVDLALTYLEQHRSHGLRSLVLEILAILENLPSWWQGLVCLGKLKAALDKNEFSLTLLREVRKWIEYGRIHPVGQLAVECSSRGEPDSRFSP